MSVILNIAENTVLAKIFPFVVAFDFAIFKRRVNKVVRSRRWAGFVKLFSHDCWHRGGYTKAQWRQIEGAL